MQNMQGTGQYRVGCSSKEEKPGRPPKLASSISSKGAGPL